MLLKTDSYEGEVFQTVYPMIVDHWFKGDLPAGVWSDEYKARVFDAFASVEYFHKTGTVDKPSRWYNVPKEMDGIGIALGWVLYATLSMCMELHFYDSIFDTPLYKTGFAPADLPGEDGLPPPGHDIPLDGMADEGAEAAQHEMSVEEKRQTTKNTTHLVCDILCDTSGTKAIKLIYVAARPLVQEHGETVVLLKTKRGTAEWWTRQAAGDWVHVLRRTMAVLSCKASLLEIGFANEAVDEHDLQFHEEKHLADTAVRYIFNLASTLIQERRVHSETFPEMFGGCIHHDNAVRERTMAYLRASFDALTKIEHHAANGNDCKFFDTFAKDLVWPSQPWCREVCIGVLETKQTRLPHEAEQELRACGKAFHTTLPNELVNNWLRKMDRANDASKMCRMSRWHKSMVSNVLEENDRPQVRVEEQDKESTQHNLPKTAFVGEHGDISLDKGILTKMKETASKAWSSPKQDYYYLAASRHALMVAMEGDPVLIKRSWNSLLVEPLSLLHKPGTPIYAVPLYANEWETVVAIPQIIQHGEQKVVSFRNALDAGVVWKTLHVVDPRGWQRMYLEVLSPGMLRAMFPGARYEIGMIPKRGTRPMSLLAFAAEHALQHLNFERLKEWSGNRHID